MDNVKNNGYYIKKIENDIDFIILHTKNVSQKDFEADELLQSAMLFRLIQISENAGRITAEFKAAASRIPWTDIAGLRNRIVHDYGNVDLSVVFSTLKDDIPELKKLISLYQ